MHIQIASKFQVEALQTFMRAHGLQLREEEPGQYVTVNAETGARQDTNGVRSLMSPLLRALDEVRTHCNLRVIRLRESRGGYDVDCEHVNTGAHYVLSIRPHPVQPTPTSRSVSHDAA